jgi:hypothetical protein
VFFDNLGLAWQYEAEGYDLGAAGWYLPDFWLPQLLRGDGSFIEIKPTAPSPDELRKVEELSRRTGRRALLLAGEPWPGSYQGCAFSAVECGVWGDDDYYWCQCARCGTVDLQFSGAANRNCECVPLDQRGDSGSDLPWPRTKDNPYGSSIGSPALAMAHAAARAVRFDSFRTSSAERWPESVR